jgi:manganese transport protein
MHSSSENQRTNLGPRSGYSTGPGALVAAAFIGPGTVTVCTLAGVGFGFELLWVMLFAIAATIVLQEMAARTGLVTGKDLTHVLREQLTDRWLRYATLALVLAAIVIGNAAYEAGNISGGRLGLQTLLNWQGAGNSVWLSLIIGLVAFLLLYSGSYRVMEKALIALVVLMSIAFLITAIITRPDPALLLQGLFRPRLSDISILTVIGLVGTTIVPYNLFLHSSLVRAKWQGSGALAYARRDTVIAVSIGGMVSMAIIVSAAAATTTEVRNAADLAQSLEPLFGQYARYFLGLGLFAAGITSAITAPLAAAFVVRGCLGWRDDMTSPGFRLVWMSVLALGVLFSSIGFSPIEIIRFAQITNGITLPLIVAILLWIINQPGVLQNHKNSGLQNLAGLTILAVTMAIGVRGIYLVLSGIS